jgi:hypothetical protein
LDCASLLTLGLATQEARELTRAERGEEKREKVGFGSSKSISTQRRRGRQ